MEPERQDQLTTRALELLENSSDDAHRVARLRELHPDERRLGEVIWRVWRQTQDERLAVAPVIQWLGQAGSDSFDVGDFQTLAAGISRRADLGLIAAPDALLWNHALETMVEKIGRDTLLIDVGDMHPRMRQAFRFALLRRGWLSASDLSDEDGQRIAEALARGWDDARTFAQEWMTEVRAPEVGRMLAVALGSVPWQRPEPVILAAPYTTPEESIAITLMLENPGHSDHARGLLNGHRDAAFELLHGRRLSALYRAFGPSFSSWSFGVTGVLGPPGLVGAVAVVLTYHGFGVLPLYQFLMVYLGAATLGRAALQRPRGPKVRPVDLDITKPGAQVLASWYRRECEARKERPVAGWNFGLRLDRETLERSEPVQVDELPVVHSLVELYRNLETGTPAERKFSYQTISMESPGDDLYAIIDGLIQKSDLSSDDAKVVCASHLKLSWILRRRTTPTEFRETWTHRAVWPLTQRCLFGAYNGYDELTVAFRIDEAGVLVDADDKTVTLPAYHSIGLVHGADLPEGVRTRWAEVFADYELVGLLEQFENTSAVLPILLQTDAEEQLRNGGWLSDDEGMAWRRPLWGIGWTVMIEVEPPFAEPSPTREIVGLTFAEGLLFDEPRAVQKVRSTQRTEKLLEHWAAELRRSLGT